MQEIRITTNPDDLDLQLIHSFISNSYWAKSIPIKTVKRSIENSLVFGAYLPSGKQVGFARVITDKATFAYLGDVFVLEKYRGSGIAKAIMNAITKHPDLQGLRRFMLATKDAHSLYSKFGFQPLDNPDRLMQIVRPNIYQ